MTNGICGNQSPSLSGSTSLTCRLIAGHLGWHTTNEGPHSAHWNDGDGHLPQASPPAFEWDTLTPCPTHGTRSLDGSGRCLPSCGFGWEVEPLTLVHPPEPVAESVHDTCLNCETGIRVMAFKGTGFCCVLCR